MPQAESKPARSLPKPSHPQPPATAAGNRLTHAQPRPPADPPPLPGLLDAYDTPLSLPAIAPRPLLALNGALDPRCPIAGVREAARAAEAAYAAAGAPPGAFRVQAFEGVGHEFTQGMAEAAAEFFDEWL
jgi:predicted esterase